uniref:Transposon Ty3-I Gag-Pol polyprotein n=1 Tax=Cajanus cajan TaxID=3821 RepID=A0A151S5K1_CAJCA|nr:Transposon Ty3-I Gag-Pol polyprotein [Cajanus cajan]
MLRAILKDNKKSWDDYPPHLEFAYNRVVHKTTNMSPFEIITYGKPPPTIPHYILGSSNIEAVDSVLTTREALYELLQKRLSKAQAAMKHSADSKLRDVHYEVGDWVYVKLRPYRQLSVSGSYHKLSKQFYGPFHIIERIGSVAYRLQLPPSSKTHPVFHCSLLKPHQGPLVPHSASLPIPAIENHPIVEPLTILDCKLDGSTSPPTKLVLVQWLGLAPEDTSWENWEDLRHIYHLEDKVFFPGEGDDNNMANTPRPKRISKRPSHLQDFV